MFEGIKQLLGGQDAFYKKIGNQRSKLDPRFTRMDDDIGLYILEDFIWKDAKDKARPNVENVTTNEPKTFADTTIATLGTAERRWDIMTETSEDEAMCEDFLNYVLYKNDEYLSLIGEYPLEEETDWNNCLRGTCCVRVLVKKSGNLWFIEIVPIDARRVTFMYDASGLAFGSVVGDMEGEDIEPLYGFKSNKKGKITMEEIWTPTERYIYINGEQEKQGYWQHNLGINPLIVQTCPTTPLIANVDEPEKHKAESIYGGLRKLYNTLNTVATSWHNQNMMQILPPMQFTSPYGRKSKTPPYGLAAIMNLKKGEKYDAMPITTVSTSHREFFAQVTAWIQRGSFSHINYGELSFELSALAIKSLERHKDQIFIPRLRAKKMLMRQIAKTIIHQYKNGGIPTDIPPNFGYELEWSPEKFDKDFRFNVDYFAVNPEESIADFTIAQTALTIGLPQEYVYKNICKVENYPEISMMKNREDADRLSPTCKKFSVGLDLLKSERREDKMRGTIIFAELGIAIENIGAVDVENVLKNPPSQPKPSAMLGMPLVGNQRKKAPEQYLLNEGNRREGVANQQLGMEAKETNV